MDPDNDRWLSSAAKRERRCEHECHQADLWHVLVSSTNSILIRRHVEMSIVTDAAGPKHGQPSQGQSGIYLEQRHSSMPLAM